MISHNYLSKYEIEKKAKELGMVYPIEVSNYEADTKEGIKEAKINKSNTSVDKENIESSDITVEVYISPGQNLDDIAKNLKNNKVINDMAAFKQYVYKKNVARKLIAGNYKFQLNSDPDEVINILVKK